MAGLEAQVRRMADLAWAAGVLDARGSFLAYRRKAGTHGLLSPRIRVRTSLGNAAHLALLESILGGHSGVHSGAGRGRREWQINGAKRVGEVLDELIPYLRVQVRAAQLLRELCTDITDETSRPFADRGLSQERIMARERLLVALQGTVAPKL